MPSRSSILIRKKESIDAVTIALPSSKSESNRALIIQAFAGGELLNLAEARDTQTMMRLLKSEQKELNVLDAGTTMRFLAAYCALTGKNKILTGTPRMCQRPIGILVDALREIGAEIEYLDYDGYPPLETVGFLHQKKREISMRGDISSQYISAIMMVAPTLPHGLTIHLQGKVASLPYLQMTMELMLQFGAQVRFETEHTIIVDPSPYQPTTFAVESDWSGASYWFAFVALSQRAEVVLTGLKPNSLQGDHKIMEIMHQLGVRSEFSSIGLKLSRQGAAGNFSYDFSPCPDLAQTVVVVCAAKGIRATFTGLESLRIKETDRILALQQELAKIGAGLEEREGNGR